MFEGTSRNLIQHSDFLFAQVSRYIAQTYNIFCNNFSKHLMQTISTLTFLNYIEISIIIAVIIIIYRYITGTHAEQTHKRYFNASACYALKQNFQVGNYWKSS